MRIITHITQEKSLEKPPKPVVISIGNFDGLHLGHSQVLEKAREHAKRENSSLTVLTFSNHPVEVLHPEQSVPLLCSLSHKKKLFEKFGVDDLILLPFTKEFAQQSARDFLSLLHRHIPFSHLILGHDATIGRGKEGDRDCIKELANEFHFIVEYVEPFSLEGEVISSRKIRGFIQQGNLSLAERLLGRRYSVYGRVIEGRTHGKLLGFPTANLDVTNLCLPPFGVYAVQVLHENRMLQGVANLGIAPTIRTDRIPILEVHLLDWEGNLYHQSIEVIFLSFIRSEMKFQNVDQLKEQITADIHAAKALICTRLNDF